MMNPEDRVGDYEECPECGNEDLERWTEEAEYGKPTNLFSRGAEAPKYKTKPMEFIHCENCDWGRP